MAESESGQDKTEDPTEKRKKDSREKGEIARSKELNTLAVTMAGAGALLVFVPSLGAFITPAILGGGKTLMIGNLIQLQFGSSHNWPFGAALAFALLSLVLLAMLSYSLRFKANAASVQV